MQIGNSNYRFIRINPNGTVTGRNFNSSSCDFNFSAPLGCNTLLSNSYFSIKLEISGRNGAGNEVLLIHQDFNTANNITNNATLSSDPCCCLFNKISHYVNNNPVSTVENVPQVDQIKNMVYESEATVNKALSSNPIWWLKKKKPTVIDALGGNSESFDTHSIDQERRLNILTNPFSKSKTNRMNFKPPLSLFNMPDPLPGNIVHRINFTISPNWKNNIITGSLNGASWQVVDEFTGNNQIRVSVVDFCLFLCVYDSNISPPKQITLQTPEIFSSVKNLTTSVSQNISITVPKGTYKILVSFFDARNGTDTRFSPTSFNQEANLLGNIRELSLSYAGEKYPNEYYRLNTFTGWDINTNTEDIGRAYTDFIINSDALAVSSSNILSFSEWVKQPIFVFKIVKQPGDLVDNCEVFIKGQNAFEANISMIIMCLYLNELVISSDQYGLPQTSEITQII